MTSHSQTRLLIEVATGIYTGDIYTDHSLKSVFGGEKSCGKRVSVGKLALSMTCYQYMQQKVLIGYRYITVKLHPQDMNLTKPGEVYHTLAGQKCQRIGTFYFDKALIVHRNPYHAIWSEYQRGGNRDRHAFVRSPYLSHVVVILTFCIPFTGNARRKFYVENLAQLLCRLCTAV